MKSSWETLHNKRLFFIRYDHMGVDGMRTEMAEVEKAIYTQPKGSVLLLVDTTGTVISPETLSMLKDAAVRSKPFVRKTAVLGVTGARRVMMDMVVKFSGMKLVAFDTADQAKDWLVQE